MKAYIMITLMIIAGLFIYGIQSFAQKDSGMEGNMTEIKKEDNNLASATFAGGCFWCTESDLEKVDGVVEVISGYTGGHKDNPTYDEVSGGGTGHTEAIRVIYDPDKVTYKELLDVLWRHIDPTDNGGQFVDRGSQYRSEIFYHDEEQKRIAEEYIEELNEAEIFPNPIVTQIVPLEAFYPAEEYHQDFLSLNPYHPYIVYWDLPKLEHLIKEYPDLVKSNVNLYNTPGSDRPPENTYTD